MSLKTKIITPTSSTPEVILDPTGLIRIKGRLIHIDISEFYGHLENWIDTYLCNPADRTFINIHLEYLNSVNLIAITGILKKFSPVNIKEKVIINWYYDDGDEDIFEQGESLSSVLNLPFNFVMTPEAIVSH